jgi:hypothetical protein
MIKYIDFARNYKNWVLVLSWVKIQVHIEIKKHWSMYFYFFGKIGLCINR